MNLTKKNKKYKPKNKTKTKTKHKTTLKKNISEKNQRLICKKYNKMNNSYNTFEDKIDKIFGDVFTSKTFNLEKSIIKDFKKAVNPLGIRPQDDFYSYINDRWIKDLQIKEEQKYIVQVDSFRLVQDKVYIQLLEIIKNEISKGKSKRSHLIKNLYQSLLKLNTNEQSYNYATKSLNKIDELRKNKNNLWKMLGLINSNEIISSGCPFTWTLNPDDKEPTKFRSFINAPQLSLIDINIYFDDGTDLNYKKKYKTEFFKYLRELFENAFGKNHGFNVEDIFVVELQLLGAMGCFEIKNAEGFYNKVTQREALEKYKFDWVQFSKELGFEHPPSFFITSNLNYLKCASEMLYKNWDSDIWRTYWIYLFIRQQQRWNKKGFEISFNFLGKFVRGQESMISIELASIYSLGFAFNTFLTNEYVDKYQNEQNVQYVKTMAEDLKAVFIRMIKRNKWLQPQTKEKALQKLYKFSLTVGSPKILREDPLLDYSNNDAWGNMLKMTYWRHRKAIQLEGNPIVDIPVIDWVQFPAKFIGTQAYVVNASYTPSKNGIYIPLGYVQKPFVDLEERGIEYNLARVGDTIGHEMSHALDDWGSKYDENGVLSDWWTEKDKAKYKEIQNDVIKQYEAFAAQDGIKFNAAPSIGEDLADISGLTICREYLRDFQLKNDDILPIKSESFKVFFIYYAVQSRQKIQDKALNAQLKTNPHPLDKYRVNIPLSRLPIFRTIYDIKKGDKMWWHSTNRIWED
jgi:putative endopeptidase